MAEKEYIEREATIEKLNKLCDRVCQYSKAQRKVMCGACPLGDAFTVIEDDIPAADVRPVVLCRDCTFFKPQQKSARWSSTTPMCSRSATIKMPPDGFCSFGVKREKS